MKKHRGPWSERSFRLREPVFEKTGDIILVVCEGEKTERNYLEGLKKRWRIHPLNVEVFGPDLGNSPVSIVKYAIELRDNRKNEAKHGKGVVYDQVWCVFDRDKHVDLDEAIDKAKGNKIYVALSVPCFEFWYLLHFTYTTRPFQDCDEVENCLKEYIKDYDKASAPLDLLMPELEKALENAKILRKHNKDTNSSCPSTDVDLLVKELQKIHS
ncbi:MAG TPA: RloB family protein [bacterium]|nr:RloB family protein [bacterium]HQL61942.1 RloB family protein [bacterium]